MAAVVSRDLPDKDKTPFAAKPRWCYGRGEHLWFSDQSGQLVSTKLRAGFNVMAFVCVALICNRPLIGTPDSMRAMRILVEQYLIARVRLDPHCWKDGKIDERVRDEHGAKGL